MNIFVLFHLLIVIFVCSFVQVVPTSENKPSAEQTRRIDRLAQEQAVLPETTASEKAKQLVLLVGWFWLVGRSVGRSFPPFAFLPAFYLLFLCASQVISSVLFVCLFGLFVV